MGVGLGECGQSGAWRPADERLDEAIEGVDAAARGGAQRLDEASVPTGSHHLASHVFGDPQYGARNMVQELPVDVAGEQQRVAFAGVVPALDRSCSCRACRLDHEETL